MGETRVEKQRRWDGVNTGYITCSLRLLEDLLKLPEDHHIVNVWYDFDDWHQKNFRIVIAGPKMPKRGEGEPIKQIFPLLTKEGGMDFDA